MSVRSSREVPVGARETVDAAAAALRAAQPCGSLARILSRVFREPKPDILDLGPLWGEGIVYIAERGARIHVEAIDPPPPTPARKPGEPPPLLEPFRLEQQDGTMHLALLWEIADFFPPDRLRELGSELRRVLRDGGYVFVLSQSRPTSENESIPRYRLLADDMIARVPGVGRPRRRWSHPTRDLEKALNGFSIQGIHLQRTQMREITAIKEGPSAARSG